jgi:2-haloacid dehalogenase
MPRIEALLFDAYGTLFDTRSAVVRLAPRLDGKADRVAQVWRQKQLEYSWTHSLRDIYRGFDVLVREALDYALAVEGVGDAGLAEALMAGFATLAPYEDAATTLQQLKQRDLRLGILSNGTPAMLKALLAGHALAADLDPVVSVEAAGIFKPSARVYQLGVDALRLKPEQIGFISGNAWDAAGAAGFGFRAFWINRGGQPPEYGLAHRATTIAHLSDLAGALP